jgi:hypothetical protein
MNILFFIGLAGVCILLGLTFLEERGLVPASFSRIRKAADGALVRGGEAVVRAWRQVDYRIFVAALTMASIFAIQAFRIIASAGSTLYRRAKSILEARVRSMHHRQSAVSFFLKDVLYYKKELRRGRDV